MKLPTGSFAPYTTIPTNILFFDKLGRTEKIWYYEVQIPNGKKNFTKTNPIRYENFTDCISLWKERPESEFSWTIPVEKVIAENYNLDFKNPYKIENLEHIQPHILVDGIIQKENQIVGMMQEIKSIVDNKVTAL